MPDLDEIVEETGDQGEPTRPTDILRGKIDDLPIPKGSSHRIHVWYIYLHLVDFYGKCR